MNTVVGHGTAWTPAPWECKSLHRFFLGAYQIIPFADRQRLRMTGKDESVGGIVERNANAHLIAAAPALYEALNALVDGIMQGDDVGTFQIAKHAGTAALKLARGQS